VITGGDGFWDGIAVRDWYRCQWCGGPAENCHHRKFKGQGGADTPENRVMLCGFGNTSGCHGRAHGRERAEAVRLGFVVPSWGDPATTRMWSQPRQVWLVAGPAFDADYWRAEGDDETVHKDIHCAHNLAA
jgi:hypothetical protein